MSNTEAGKGMRERRRLGFFGWFDFFANIATFYSVYLALVTLTTSPGDDIRYQAYIPIRLVAPALGLDLSPLLQPTRS